LPLQIKIDFCFLLWKFQNQIKSINERHNATTFTPSRLHASLFFGGKYDVSGSDAFNSQRTANYLLLHF
jgi:hypothetical protein